MTYTLERGTCEPCCIRFCCRKRYVGTICSNTGFYQCIAEGANIGYKNSLKEAKKAFIKWHKAMIEIWGYDDYK